MTILEALSSARELAIEKRHSNVSALNEALSRLDLAVVLLEKGYPLDMEVALIMGDQTDPRGVSDYEHE